MIPFFINDVPIECINKAAVTYHVPATMIVSILKIEGGKKGMASRNSDGSYDYGPMQINSCWIKTIEKYGYTAHDIRFNPCANVMVGAWILATNIANSEELWRGVGNYHSHTPAFNQKYRYKVQQFHKWLAKEINK